VEVLARNISGARPHPTASAVARANNGGLRAEPPARSRGRDNGQGGQGAKPPKAEALLIFGRLMEATNLPAFLKFGKKT